MPPAGDFAIRDARTGESTSLTELMLRSKAYWGYDDAFMAACRDVLFVSEEMIAAGQVFVAEYRDGVVGVAAVVDTPPDVELDACFVDPTAIGTGVGRLLVDTAKARARHAGARTMRVVSDPNAATFYARLGAQPAGEVPSDIAGARPLPLLRFDLTR